MPVIDADTPNPSDPLYIMGDSEHERDRLVQQAGLFGPFTRRFLLDAGITPGMRVMDVGCGVGDVSLLCAELVGRDGAVVGVDRDPGVLAKATERASAAGLCQVSFREGDFRSLPNDLTFDAAVGRLVLMYTVDPADAIRSLLPHLRAGGIVAFQEFDFTSFDAVPPCALWNQIIARRTSCEVPMTELMPIAAAYATPAQGAGPMLVTLKAGLFEKHGLAVEAQDRGRALSVVAGLMAGELQFGNLAAPSMLRMVLNGEADVVFLALGINQQFLVSRPGLANRRDLGGARLGRSGDGAITDVLTLFLQEQLGQEGVAGTTLVPLAGTNDNQVAALLHAEYDAVVLTPPAAIEAQRRGCHLVIDLADYGLNYSLGGIAARRSYVAAHPDVALAFITAYIEGLHRYRTDRAFTVSVLQAFSGQSDRSLMEDHYDMTMPGMPKTPYPRTDGLAKVLRVMARDLPAAASADPADFVDDRFVRELDESGFITSLYSS